MLTIFEIAILIYNVFICIKITMTKITINIDQQNKDKFLKGEVGGIVFFVFL